MFSSGFLSLRLGAIFLARSEIVGDRGVFSRHQKSSFWMGLESARCLLLVDPSWPCLFTWDSVGGISPPLPFPPVHWMYGKWRRVHARWSNRTHTRKSRSRKFCLPGKINGQTAVSLRGKWQMTVRVNENIIFSCAKIGKKDDTLFPTMLRFFRDEDSSENSERIVWKPSRFPTSLESHLHTERTAFLYRKKNFFIKERKMV